MLRDQYSHRSLRYLAICVILIGAQSFCSAQIVEEYKPKIEAASAEGRSAIERIKIPEGFEISLFAAEPMIANPVAFYIDGRGRFFVAETFRLHAGVTDARDHMYWLDDDLASKTVADRVAMYKKHLGGLFDTYTAEHDRIRRIVDTDGDGKADEATVFADGFRNASDGIGAGLLTRKDKVWFTCIPDLWLFEDKNDDGKADVRKSLQTGYGVHVGFLGHDLHGLRFGPDGRIYFTIGDRGLNVETPNGTIAYPDTGCVLRCWPDGSELEVFASGLRNPQELAFDELGNLFTVDNNSDAGDKARVVHIVDGGDSGWRIGYQFIQHPNSRGPWNAEKLWDPEKAKEAYYLLPPLANYADGPSGLAYYPGTGFRESYVGTFFLCDFRGTFGQSGIRTFKLKPKGTTFEVTDREEFSWSVLATDVDFGPDGALYLTDWVDGWNKTGKGRIYRIADSQTAGNPLSKEVQSLLADDMQKRSIAELIGRLDHADQRVRQEAQFTLAEMGASAIEPLNARAKKPENLLGRVHSLWALAQIGRLDVHAADLLVPFLSDRDAEIRSQTAKVLGELCYRKCHPTLVTLLHDDSTRVRFSAGLALRRLGKVEGSDEKTTDGLMQVLRENGDEDPYLRHAAVMGLTGNATVDQLTKATTDHSKSVRIGATLALRRLGSPAVAEFLNDSDSAVVLETARAICDVPITGAFDSLAKLSTRADLATPLARRVLNVNYRKGENENAKRIVAMTQREDLSLEVRVEAMESLRDWAKPSGRDRVTGLWWPLPERSATPAVDALAPAIADILQNGPQKLAQPAIEAAATLQIRDATSAIFTVLKNTDRASFVRGEAIKALGALEAPNLEEAVRFSLEDKSSAVRTEGRKLLARLHPDEAIQALAKVLSDGSVDERQGAFATLAEIPQSGADQVLASWLSKLAKGEVTPEVELDLLLAAQKRTEPAIQKQLADFETGRVNESPVTRFKETLVGGNSDEGKKVFFERTEAACLRCHLIRGRGGEVGPDLSKIGGQQKREYILESLVAPNQQIAKGFDSVVLTTVDGDVVTGVWKEENDDVLKLMTAEGKLIQVAKANIEERTRGKSAMPDDVTKHLSKTDLRNLVEYLSSLR